MTIEKKAYQAPELTAVSFRAEQGFVSSTLSLWHPELDPADNRQVEDYGNHSHWQQGSNNFWD